MGTNLLYEYADNSARSGLSFVTCYSDKQNHSQQVEAEYRGRSQENVRAEDVGGCEGKAMSDKYCRSLRRRIENMIYLHWSDAFVPPTRHPVLSDC